MNRIDFTQTGGFPLDQDVFGFQQVNINTAMQPAAVFGSLAIISGCSIIGSTVSNGYVVINGEVLPFEAGIIEEKVRIVETRTDLSYEDGVDRPSQINRIVRFGDDAGTTYTWTDFKRNTPEGVLARLERLEWLTAPDRIDGGSMRLWRKSADISLPAGWREVVDWQDRVLRGRKPGVANFEVGDTGGDDSVTLNMGHIPEHDHGLEGGGYHQGVSDNADDRDVMVPGGSDRTGKAGSVSPTPISLLPKYRIIMFIEPIPNYIN
jgi:hypothetical protein